MKFLLEIEKPNKRYCYGCRFLYINICNIIDMPTSLEKDKEGYYITPPECPLIKVSHNIEDPKWCPCSVKEANEKALNNAFNGKYIPEEKSEIPNPYHEIKDEIARKIRIISKEFSDFNEDIPIVTPYLLGDTVLGHPHVYAPSIACITLAECGFKLAREFENS